MNKKGGEMSGRQDAKRSKGGSPCEYLQRSMAFISSAFFNEFVTQDTRIIARAVQAEFHPDGMTILQANQAAGWQTVPHCHLHVLPRYVDDGVELVWPRKEPGMQALLQYAEKIRASSEMISPA
ncbi:HIT family protein [Undibacterium sp.]|uniref:HIT family protein n=1 Tax=Undibacterium sp. TaxID=1914977 RepID=UPI002B612491|nr:HIT family protein [Undibacterium sp.]HTD06171.1 HIT family protein [Undibacterium sp.]